MQVSQFTYCQEEKGQILLLVIPVLNENNFPDSSTGSLLFPLLAFPLYTVNTYLYLL